jgi:ribosomal protein S18 acetylase RimI-like enzyme
LIDAAGFGARGMMLRPARSQDASFLRALFESARPDAALLAQWPETVRRAFLDQQFEFQTIHYARSYPDAARFVIQRKDEPIGRTIVARSAREWSLVDIALLPRWRGQGIGTMLLQGIKSAAVEAGTPAVRLSVDIRNPARRLYQRLGFVATELEEGAADVEMVWRTEAVS